MKYLMLFLLISLSVFADTESSRQFNYNGSGQHESYTLRTENTHTEWRTEQRERTCWRRVFDGYRRECHTEYRTICRREGERTVCRQEPYQVCQDVPVYRNEPYTCYETVQVPYEVFDYFVQGNYKINFLSEAPNANENFSLVQNGDDFGLSVRSSGNYLISATKNVQESYSDQLKTIDVTYSVLMNDLAPEINVIRSGITNLVTPDKKIISMQIAQHSGVLPLVIHLKAVMPISWGRDVLMIDRDLKAVDYQIVNVAGIATVMINPFQVIEKFKEKYFYDFTVTLKLETKGANIINLRDIGSLEASKAARLQF
jgi:hypothetical protein